MQRFRMCPISGFPCFKRPPKGVRAVRVHANVPVCGVVCATAYAKSKGEILVGEHRISDPRGSSIEYSIGSPQHSVEKSKK